MGNYQNNTMPSLGLTTFALYFLTASVFAFSASTVPSALVTRVTTEQWDIPNLELHMMTKLTGLPGQNPWPDEMKFLTTIDFNINMPGHQTAHCHNEFTNGTLPDDLVACTSEGSRVRFRMKEYTALGKRRPELSFVLQVFRVDRAVQVFLDPH
jgi:hypothetical protein